MEVFDQDKAARARRSGTRGGPAQSAHRAAGTGPAEETRQETRRRVHRHAAREPSDRDGTVCPSLIRIQSLATSPGELHSDASSQPAPPARPGGGCTRPQQLRLNRPPEVPGPIGTGQETGRLRRGEARQGIHLFCEQVSDLLPLPVAGAIPGAGTVRRRVRRPGRRDSPALRNRGHCRLHRPGRPIGHPAPSDAFGLVEPSQGIQQAGCNRVPPVATQAGSVVFECIKADGPVLRLPRTPPSLSVAWACAPNRFGRHAGHGYHALGHGTTGDQGCLSKSIWRMRSGCGIACG